MPIINYNIYIRSFQLAGLLEHFSRFLFTLLENTRMLRFFQRFFGFVDNLHNFFAFLKNYVKKHLTDPAIGANIKMQ
jgi:hypothetical protein